MSPLIRIPFYLLSIVAAAFMLLAGWAKAAALLNAKSDLSVLMGAALIIAMMIFGGISVYLLLKRLLPLLPRGPGEKSTPIPSEAALPKSLFNASTDHQINQFSENERSQHHHE
ncbi:MAG: hypothetical protein WKF84_03980 [Pyrinomonadaceae bacterium]